jgi:hypothetical protein
MAAGMIKFVDDAVMVRQYATVYAIPTSKSLGAVSLDADPRRRRMDGRVHDRQRRHRHEARPPGADARPRVEEDPDQAASCCAWLRTSRAW